ncbi:MAG TPA: hypothetical protein VIM46_08965, partial [Luteolibacter sp.]
RNSQDFRGAARLLGRHSGQALYKESGAFLNRAAASYAPLGESMEAGGHQGSRSSPFTFTVDAVGVGKKQDARGASDWVA